jgi:hypothetical protein
MGAVGDDRLADFLTWVLDGYGIDTRLLARKPGLQTSATILPIRPSGERPALHAPGATASLTRADVDLDVIAAVDVLHVGGSAPSASRRVLTAQAGGVPRLNSMIALTGMVPCEAKTADPPTAHVALVPGMCAVTVKATFTPDSGVAPCTFDHVVPSKCAYRVTDGLSPLSAPVHCGCPERSGVIDRFWLMTPDGTKTVVHVLPFQCEMVGAKARGFDRNPTAHTS